VISARHGSGVIATVSLRLLYLIFLQVLGLVLLLGRTAEEGGIDVGEVDRKDRVRLRGEEIVSSSVRIVSGPGRCRRP
jgi:hypothetical protein